MQIVIDIQEEIYNYIHNEHIAMRVCDSHKVANAIANGTPLAEMLNKIKDEFISLYPKNYAGEPELGGSSCSFSLNQVLAIIDKYM